jgi:steroid delta-isomerase-like uncharacterized protein
MRHDNPTLARRWFEEVWNERRTEIIDELVTAESVCYSEAGELRGKQAFMDLVHGPFLTAFPDLHVTVDEVADAGDVSVVRWTAKGTHTGDLPGMPATGRRITFRGLTWIRYRDGKMVEGFDCWNQSGLFQALASGSPPPSMSLA